MMISSSNNRRIGRRNPYFTLLIAVMLVGSVSIRGHVLAPDSVLNPKTPAEAWNVLRLSTENVARLLKENRLAEIPEQVSLCSPSLRFLPGCAVGSPEIKRQAAVEAVQAAAAIISLAQASLAGDRATAEAMLASLHNHLTLMSAGYDPALAKADIFFCPMHPDFVSAESSAHCAKCGMSLLPRRIPYSFVYVPAGESTIRLSVSDEGHLTRGQARRVKIRLTRQDGSAVLPSDLLVMHTQPIHLLIVDPTLRDYHHEHPVATDAPGEYCFSFVPNTGSSYRIFADLVPTATGVQEYPFADLPGEGGARRGGRTRCGHLRHGR